MQLSISVKDLIRELSRRYRTIAFAESCTGGMLCSAIVSEPGASAVFKGGIIAYSDNAKIKLLHVSEETLREHGAVSSQTVVSMALGALKQFDADITAATSGIAGPGGGSGQKRVGTVWFGYAVKGHDGTITTDSHCCHFPGNRDKVRAESVAAALEGIARRAGILPSKDAKDC